MSPSLMAVLWLGWPRTHGEPPAVTAVQYVIAQRLHSTYTIQTFNLPHSGGRSNNKGIISTQARICLVFSYPLQKPSKSASVLTDHDASHPFLLKPNTMCPCSDTKILLLQLSVVPREFCDMYIKSPGSNSNGSNAGIRASL